MTIAVASKTAVTQYQVFMNLESGYLLNKVANRVPTNGGTASGR